MWGERAAKGLNENVELLQDLTSVESKMDFRAHECYNYVVTASILWVNAEMLE